MTSAEHATSSTERQQMADLADALGWRQVDTAPDHRPAVTLRQELARDRLQGYPFDLIWADEVWGVLHAFEQAGALSRSEVAGWAVVFRDTEPIWRAAYERSQPSLSRLTRELIA